MSMSLIYAIDVILIVASGFFIILAGCMPTAHTMRQNLFLVVGFFTMILLFWYIVGGLKIPVQEYVIHHHPNFIMRTNDITFVSFFDDENMVAGAEISSNAGIYNTNDSSLRIKETVTFNRYDRKIKIVYGIKGLTL